MPKECVAVLIGLYKKNGVVSCVGFDFIPKGFNGYCLILGTLSLDTHLD